MKKVFIIGAVVIIVVLLILRQESAPTVSIPQIPSTITRTQEVSLVEAYLASVDIERLTGESPVLGGTWRIISTEVDPTARTAAIVYEDGHIQGKGIVSYSIDQTTKSITVNGFTRSQ